MELLWCFIVAGVLVSDWFADVKDAMFGKGFPRHERRKQQRQHDHELRKLRLQQRHAERLAGKAGPTIGEAVAHRIRTSRPKTRDEMHGFRAWWWDLSDDTAKMLTEERRARHERVANGQGDARRAWEWAKRHAKAWQERNQARRAWDEQPPTVHETADRTDWPDPGAPDTTPVDAEVVDDPKPGPPPRSQRPELEPGWPEWGEPEPKAGPDPAVPENPPGTVRAVVERIPKPPDGSPAGNSLNQGADSMTYPVPVQNHGAVSAPISGETVDPESLVTFAHGMGAVADRMQAEIEASIANLTAKGVSGEPIDDLHSMLDAAATLAGRSYNVRGAGGRHSDIQGVAHSDPTVGGEQYLGIGAARR